MKKIISSMCLMLCIGHVFGQKPLIDTSIYGKWPQIVYNGLSPDGAFIWYTYRQQLTLKALKSNWSKSVKVPIDYKAGLYFADNSRLAIYQTTGDSLCIQTLGTDRVRYIINVKSFKIPQNDNAEWLLYETGPIEKTFVTVNLKTGKQRVINAVTTYRVAPTEKYVLLEQAGKDNSTNLSWLELRTQRATTIWQGRSPTGLLFTHDGNTMAFIGKDGQGQENIWYYHSGDEKARVLINVNSSEFPRELTLVGLRAFNSLGDRLFLNFTGNTNSVTSKPNPTLASVDVYSYKDARLQSEQLSNVKGLIRYIYIFNLATNKLFRLTGRNESLLRSGSDELTQSQNYVLVKKENGGSGEEGHWNPTGLNSLYLVSTTDGRKTCLLRDEYELSLMSYRISPGEKYILFYDPIARNYFSYIIATGERLQVTSSIVGGWLEPGDGYQDSIYDVDAQYHWLQNDQAVLINTQTDIYQADPSGKKPMLCLTGQFGHKNHLRFIVARIQSGSRINDGSLNPAAPLLLNVFNMDTEGEGFCKVKPNKENKPALLKMMSCLGMDALIKAKDAEVYLGKLESANRFPNLFITKDFRDYTPITNIQPQKSYNWLTSELIIWKLPNGVLNKGILYKPENFDSTKQYPVILTYYQQSSMTLNQFLMPEYSEGSELNIPTYVSNGYLVFEPDIHYTAGHSGQSACDAIVSAAEYLGRLHYVDKDHMGLMGHSMGGFETNYVVTHSHLFAAAVSLSGVSDQISEYNSIRSAGYTGGSQQDWVETGQYRMGATLWERPDLYLENSPVLQADNVTTPVLLMANHQDGAVHYTQGLELFLALRRLGKKAWLLQYDKDNHAVVDPTDDKDVTLRMQQFFDYYLKRKTPPIWMTEGIPAVKKQVDSGLELDYSGKQP